ncbi:sulfate transporter family-domain-containing protein [Pholiota molesta]|nr:sulfate transporter family-domain-containing protein [Pholiota molesta]
MKNEIYRTPEHARTAVRAVPAVLLGCLLNILDGVSYGMIIFPATGVFADLGGMGVSMFFVSAIVAQLVYTLGGSGFAGANGSMMIEVVPFFHILATSIASQIGEDQPAAIIATTLVAYALVLFYWSVSLSSSWRSQIGVVVGFFPRHILVGCIGGVGAFLIETGLTVSMRISDDDFDFTWKTFEIMFFDSHNLILWTIPLLLAILLRLITHKFHHQLIFPAYFIIIPIIFYIVVFAARLDLGDLRRAGWLFDMSSSAEEPWYTFYNYFDFSLISYSALWSTLPTQFALLFFNILHPPLNVPALSVSLNNDVDTNKELVAHGYSNLLAGFIGTVPNYLVYVNTLLFYRVGGDNRIAGFMLAVATVVLLVIGSGPIAFIPVMVVASLIFVLGIDLVKEALWDNRHRVTRSEYITIVSIMVCMTVWDFVIGVLFGIIVCCFFFVVQNSQLRSIRAIYTGDLAMSAVRRPSLQRAYIREVSKQTTILRLQGFLFFGTITHVEESIRKLLEAPYWHQRPIQFLVVDLSLVGGIDMSAAEAFVRIHRLLEAKRITLVFCGFSADSTVGRALRSVEVLGARGVELFGTFSDAMEWTENAYLRAWFQSQKIEVSSNTLSVPNRADPNIEYSHLVGSFVRSPRRSHIRDAGDRTIATVSIQPHPDINLEPLNTLAKAFSSYGNIDTLFFQPISNYLERISVAEGHILWNSGDPADGLYIIESGVLRAVYQFANPTQHFEESMVAGALAGEMSALSDSPRNATVVAEAPSVLWKLSNQNIQRLQTEEPELSRVFMQLVLKAAKLDYDILLSAIASRQ